MIQLNGSQYFALNHENFIHMKRLPLKIVQKDEPGMHEEEMPIIIDIEKVPLLFDDLKQAKIVSPHAKIADNVTTLIPGTDIVILGIEESSSHDPIQTSINEANSGEVLPIAEEMQRFHKKSPSVDINEESYQ